MQALKKLMRKLWAPVAEIPTPLLAPYYPFMDGLRGVSILMVLFAHFGINHYLHPLGLLVDSTTAVHVFFIISGYLVTTLLLKEKIQNGQIRLKYFYLRRCLRILPVAYLFLVVLGVLNAIYNLHLQRFDFVGAAVFIKNLPVSGSYYTAHFWSLAVEEQYYLMLPALLVFNVEYYLMTSLLVILMVPVICIAGYYAPAAFGHLLLTKVCMYAFWKGPVIILIGSVTSILDFKGLIPRKILNLNPWYGRGLLLLAIIIHTPISILYAKYISEYVSCILIAAAIVIFQRQKTVFTNKVLLKIGVLSYSLYIWQQLFVGSNVWQPWMRRFYYCPLWALILVKLLLVFTIARLSYRFEQLFLRLKNKLNYRRLPQ